MKLPYLSTLLLLASLSVAFGCGTDARRPADTGTATDSGATTDTGTEADSGPSTDSGPSADSGAPTDAGPDADAGAPTAVPYCYEPCAGGFCRGGFTCIEALCLPNRDTPASCSDNTDCVPQASFWDEGDPCTSGGGECSPSEVCIRLDDGGHCARTPSCRSWAPEELSWPDIDGTMVTVCGRTSYVCDGGACRLGCMNDEHCGRDYLPQCNTTTNRCVCTTEGSDSCTLNSLGGVFCAPDGACGCRTNDDCPNPGFEECYDGTCGCADTAACGEFVMGVETVCAPTPPR